MILVAGATGTVGAWVTKPNTVRRASLNRETIST